jgi:polyvinyl alcohol dehydrogenase (cytochrome)
VVAGDAYRDRGDSIDPKILAGGARIYTEVCSSCHDQGVNRAPQRYIIAQLQPETIHRALTSGVMQPMAVGLDDNQKRAVAQYITMRSFGAAEAVPPKMCAADQSQFDFDQPPPFTGWGMDLAGTHHIPDAEAGIGRANVKRLRLKWAVGFPDALRARSQPAIAGGTFIVGSHSGAVYALDQSSGCARWIFQAKAEVRTGIIVSPWTTGDRSARPLAYFGDLVGNAYAIDAVTGKEVWRIRSSDHASATLSAAPALHGNTLYIPVSSLEEGASGSPGYACCTFRGSLLAVDAATGVERWRTWFTGEATPRGLNNGGGQKYGPSGVAIWNTPAIDPKRGLLFLDTGDNYSSPATDMSDAIIALDMTTGKIRWSYQAEANDAWNASCAERDRSNCPDEDGPDNDFGAGVVLAQGADGRDVVMAGQKSGFAYGLDPDSGTLLWKTRVGRGGVVGGIHFGMASADGKLFVPISDVPDGRKHSYPASPGMFALDVKTGDFVWKALQTQDVCGGRDLCHPGYSAAITATSQLVFAGGNDGHVRAYDVKDGAVLWDVDTTASVTTVSGLVGHGGSMSGGAAPIAWKGMLLVNSGYGFAGKMPGNVMLVYSVE